MNKQDTEKLIKPHIQRCRAGDWEHAKRVANWIEVLGEDRDDLEFLITASLIHDIGWRDIVPSEKLTFTRLRELEDQANTNSEPYATEILQELGYSNGDTQKVLRLIRAADEHESNADDEAIIVDSDTLSKLNIDHIREKYKQSDWQNVYRKFVELSETRTKTEKAKELIPDLLRQLQEDISKEI